MSEWFPRWLSKNLAEAVSDTPVVLVLGPRQSGKTSLVRRIEGATYASLDEGISLEAAIRDPKGFLSAHEGVLILDEVQRAPQLFRELKAEVDRDRRPGRFVLTGSANVLLAPRLSDSLAGRMEILTLHPLSQGEIERQAPTFLERLFAEPWPTGPACPREEALDRAERGGYPEAIRRSPARRRAWFQGYIDTIVERDVRDLAQIEGRTSLPRLLRALALAGGGGTNVAGLARETGIAPTTLNRYLALLAGVFLIRQVPAWSVSNAMRSPRTIFCDSGVLLHLAGRTPQSEDLALENLLLTELLAQADLQPGWHVESFRSIRGHSVSAVVRNPEGSMAGVSLCASSNPTPEDLRGLEFLREVAGERYQRGLLLHLGDETRAITSKLGMAPLSALWNS